MSLNRIVMVGELCDKFYSGGLFNPYVFKLPSKRLVINIHHPSFFLR